jgi:hypothetical protein
VVVGVGVGVGSERTAEALRSQPAKALLGGGGAKADGQVGGAPREVGAVGGFGMGEPFSNLRATKKSSALGPASATPA